jgi:hypothetical protein
MESAHGHRSSRLKSLWPRSCHTALARRPSRSEKALKVNGGAHRRHPPRKPFVARR